MSGEVKEREWDHPTEPDNEPFISKEGNEVIGFHPRAESDDPDALLAGFEAYYRSLCPTDARPVQLRPILVRSASEVECRIYGWEEGTFVRCTTRAKNPQPMWQIEIAAADQQKGTQHD